jgi:predicted metalloprotease with PDZ domain
MPVYGLFATCASLIGPVISVCQEPSPARYAQLYENQPGRGFIALSDASIADWINPVESIDLYSGGEVVGFLLDVEIRRATNSQRTLDDVMRLLYSHAKLPRYRGYSENDLIQCVNTVAGHDLTNVFVAYVHGRGQVDYNAALHDVGVTVKTIKAQDETRYAVELSTDLSPEQQSFWHHFLANQVQTSDPSQSPRLR